MSNEKYATVSEMLASLRLALLDTSEVSTLHRPPTKWLPKACAEHFQKNSQDRELLSSAFARGYRLFVIEVL